MHMKFICSSSLSPVHTYIHIGHVYVNIGADELFDLVSNRCELISASNHVPEESADNGLATIAMYSVTKVDGKMIFNDLDIKRSVINFVFINLEKLRISMVSISCLGIIFLSM